MVGHGLPPLDVDREAVESVAVAREVVERLDEGHVPVEVAEARQVPGDHPDALIVRPAQQLAGLLGRRHPDVGLATVHGALQVEGVHPVLRHGADVVRADGRRPPGPAEGGVVVVGVDPGALAAVGDDAADVPVPDGQARRHAVDVVAGPVGLVGATERGDEGHELRPGQQQGRSHAAHGDMTTAHRSRRYRDDRSDFTHPQRTAGVTAACRPGFDTCALRASTVADAIRGRELPPPGECMGSGGGAVTEAIDGDARYTTRILNGRSAPRGHVTLRTHFDRDRLLSLPNRTARAAGVPRCSTRSRRCSTPTQTHRRALRRKERPRTCVDVRIIPPVPRPRREVRRRVVR